jgi:hypothetical protein
MPSDSRTLVDRVLDRIKNNRIAAALVLACIGLGAAASLTDSTRTLAGVVASMKGSPSLAGEWKSGATAFYPSYGEEFMRLYLQEAAGDQVIGFIQFSGNDDVRPRRFPILEGRRNGNSVSLLFDSGYRVRETVSVEPAGTGLRLVYQWQGRAAVAAIAQPVVQATQLVEGRWGILYRKKEYPDPRSACTRLLQELDPPQFYKRSEAPDEYGNVHCAGKLDDGRDGFDMFQNDVQQQLICPEKSRATLVDGRKPAKTAKGCECDGELMASGAECVPKG